MTGKTHEQRVNDILEAFAVETDVGCSLGCML